MNTNYCYQLFHSIEENHVHCTTESDSVCIRKPEENCQGMSQSKVQDSSSSIVDINSTDVLPTINIECELDKSKYKWDLYKLIIWMYILLILI